MCACTNDNDIIRYGCSQLSIPFVVANVCTEESGDIPPILTVSFVVLIVFFYIMERFVYPAQTSEIGMMFILVSCTCTQSSHIYG